MAFSPIHGLGKAWAVTYKSKLFDEVQCVGYVKASFSSCSMSCRRSIQPYRNRNRVIWNAEGIVRKSRSNDASQVLTA
jgi:hypothetical protein